MSFILEKEFKFEAAHQLPQHDGKCRRLHGHSWKGRVVVEGTHLIASGPKTGMVMDYSDIKAALDPLVEGHLDHYYLNDSTGLENPTSENLALWVFTMLRDKIPGLVAVVIDETCTSRCTYSPIKKWFDFGEFKA